MLFLRSVLLRRQRLAAAQAGSLQFAPSPWQLRGDRGMDVVRPEPAVTNLSPLSGITRTRTQGSDSRDQLPRYEAPPPGYDVIIKDLERGDASQLREGEERGESSHAGPPGYNITDRGGDGTVVAVNQVPESVPVNLAGSGTPNREGLFRIDVRRAWSGLGR